MPEKMWGGEPFWGLSYDWDPDWVLTERQKELRGTLIELCEQEMRANAKRSDDELLYPRRNLELMGEHGFLALTVPEEYGGLGENHVAFSMVCETLARYGCASTAMCYVMHIGAVSTIMLRPTPELVDKYIRPLNSGKIGTLSYSDPEDRLALLVSDLLRSGALQRRLQGAQEGVVDDVGRLRGLLRRPDHVARLLRLRRPLRVRHRRRHGARRSPRCGTRSASAGNQSGPIQVDNVEIPATRSSGPIGDGAASNDEAVDPWFLVGSSSVWNGITLGRDRHRQAPHDAQAPRRRRHARRRLPDDPGLRRRGVMDTNACRCSCSPSRRRWTAHDDNTRILEPGESPGLTTCTGRGRSSSRRRRTPPTSWTRCSTPAAGRATSATWSSSATCATRRPAG
jgi:hypothetical protein